MRALAAVLVLLAACLLHLRLGAAEIPARAILQAITAFDPTNYAHVVVVFQRITRLAVAVFSGAVLGVAGLLLQKIMQNGLVSPSTLGINAGATSFVVLAVYFFGLGGAALFLPALAGGLGAMALTFMTARLLAGQGDPRMNLVLGGAMVGTLFSSVTAFVVALDPDGFTNLLGWLIGDIGNFDYKSLSAMAPFGIAGLIGAVLLSRMVDVLAMGQEQAAVLGVDTRLVHGGALLIAIVLTVSAVTVVGPIGFVGLVMPHVARLVAGEVGLLPLWLCLIGGATVLTLADVLARVLMAPQVLNVGTVMGLAGGAVFLALVLTRARGAQI